MKPVKEREWPRYLIVSDVCLIIQAPMAEWYSRWSRKQEIPGSIPGQAHFSFFLYYLPTAKQSPVVTH